MPLTFTDVDTPAGAARLVWNDAPGRVLVGLWFADRGESMSAWLTRRFGAAIPVPSTVPGGAVDAFRRYVDGDLRALDAIEVDTGGTEFQRRVWAELRRILPGTTISYSRLAEAIGRPSATRAVAAANGANPISIVVPCHRVIAANGQLWGYGGGLDRKRWLLVHEGALLA